MNEVKLVKVPNVIKEVVHVCRPNGLDARKAEKYVWVLFPGQFISCPICKGMYYSITKDEK